MNSPGHEAEEPHRDNNNATLGASPGKKRHGGESGQMYLRHNAVGAPALVVSYHEVPGAYAGDLVPVSGLACLINQG